MLLGKDYEVHGILKRNSVAENQTARLDDVYSTIKDNLYYADMTDMASLVRVLQEVQPDEIYNLAAQSHVRISFDQPLYTTQTVAVGTMNLLEGIRLIILFNHESERRGIEFVTRKITDGVAKIHLDLSDKLMLGNLKATRDWGHANDYVKCMWLILQHDTPDDFVCSTGISHSVKDLCEYVFGKLDLDYKDYVGVDEKYFRPEELNDLKGDCTKAINMLGWKHEYTFESMLDEMIGYQEGLYL